MSRLELLWVVSCLAAVAAPARDELRAKRLVLVDEHGAERATLGTDEEETLLTLKSATSEGTLFVGPDGAGVSLEYYPDEDPSNVLNLIATRRGAWIGGTWNDQQDFDLSAEERGANLTLHKGEYDENEHDSDQEKPAVELRSCDGAGSLLLREHGQERYHAP